MSKVLWRIYYGDRTTYDNITGAVYVAPTRNVQAVASRGNHTNSERGHSLLHKHDFYWFDQGEMYGGDIFGLTDYLMEPGPKKVFFGRSIPSEEFRAIVTFAMNDPDFR